MSYVPRYISIQRVETEAVIRIDGDSIPNETEVLDIIAEIEAEVITRRLGSHHFTNQLIDVLPVEGMSRDTVVWMEYITRYGYSPTAGRVVVPDILPIISIDRSGCHERTSDLWGDMLSSGAAISGGYGASSGYYTTWDYHGSGLPSAGARNRGDYIVLSKETKGGQQLGFALYFFQNAPATGVDRIRLSYNAGWNLPRRILRRYVAKRVAIEVLGMKRGANEPAGLSQFRGGNLQSYVGSQYDERILGLQHQIEWIEKNYFPEETHVAMGII